MTGQVGSRQIHGGGTAFQARQVHRVAWAFRVPFHLRDIGLRIGLRRTADEEYYLDPFAQQVLCQALP